MKFLVIGSGGREHAICYKLSKSPSVKKVFVAPGNDGMKDCAKLVNISEFEQIAKFCNENCIDYVFVGPEQPLANGLVDFLNSKKINVIGPTKLAAEIESSKVFAKNLMKKYNVPTAGYNCFDSYDEAYNFLKNTSYPKVIKADGLAAGKGVVIVNNFECAENTIKSIMLDKAFNQAGNNIVIEEFLIGYEASVFAFCDGENYKISIFSQDHKPVYDGDKGPNTGGMGAYAPVNISNKVKQKVEDTIIKPVLDAMKKEGRTYTGVLYAGLMICDDIPKVIEFNCRFGDPETEVILPLLKTDFALLCKAICEKQIDSINLQWYKGFAVTVVAASKGYPGSYPKNLKITIDELNGDAKIYFAGVKQNNNNLYTNGGRVLMLTATQDTLKKAIDLAYENIKKVNFDGIYYRNDIAFKGL